MTFPCVCRKSKYFPSYLQVFCTEISKISFAIVDEKDFLFSFRSNNRFFALNLQLR